MVRKPGRRVAGLLQVRAAVRPPAGIRGPALPLGNPRRYRLEVDPGLAAQVRRAPGQRLVELAFRRPLEDPGHLG